MLEECAERKTLQVTVRWNNGNCVKLDFSRSSLSANFSFECVFSYITASHTKRVRHFFYLLKNTHDGNEINSSSNSECETQSTRQCSNRSKLPSRVARCNYRRNEQRGLSQFDYETETSGPYRQYIH